MNTENEMAGWPHQVNGHEIGQTPGDGKGQGSLACCCPWGHKESGMTWRLNNNEHAPCFRNCVKFLHALWY